MNIRPIVQTDSAASAKAEAERIVLRWVRELNDPESVALDQRAMDDLVDLVALQAHNGESLIVLTTNGSSDPLDPTWLDDMLAHGPNGRGMTGNWLIHAVYAQARILASRSGASVIDAIAQAAEQLEAAARARPNWNEKNDGEFASLRRVVDNYVNRPRENARQKLAEHPRQALAQSIRLAMNPDTQPVGFRKPAAPIRRSWFARIRHALTHSSIEGMRS
jgi:hypothetical protein